MSWAPLTAQQRNELPNADHTSLFTRDEVLGALRLLVSAEVAGGIVNELYSENRGPGTFFYGQLLDALSTVSESAAARVRTIVPGPENARP